MRILFRLLLPTAATAMLLLSPSVFAQENSVKPAKSAQDCADELLRNKEAIEAAGETPQEFFHRCWWDSVPGKPTPIKTPRATWDPGRGHPPRNAAKPTTEVKKSTEPRKAIEANRVIETKRAVETKRAIEVKKEIEPKKTLQVKPDEAKPAVASKQASETKSAKAAKPSTGGTRPNALVKAVDAATAPKPAAKPASVVEAKPVRKDAAAPKPAAATPPEKAKKDVSAVKTPDTKVSPAKMSPSKGAVVTAPDAAPASVKPASPGAVVVKSGAKPKPARVAAKAPHARAAHNALARPLPPPEWRPSRRVATYPVPSSSYRYAYRPAPLRFAARANGRRALAPQGVVLCLYGQPDASGRSACVPVP